jgi:hypothetical protein
MIVVGILFPCRVTAEGVIVRSPLVSVPVQNKPPRLALFKARALGLGAPATVFHLTRTEATSMGACGFVIVIAM